MKKAYSDSDKCSVCYRHSLRWKKKKLTPLRKTRAHHYCKYIVCDTKGCPFLWYDNKFKVMKGKKCDCKDVEIIKI